jgi:hypothetical protein
MSEKINQNRNLMKLNRWTLALAAAGIVTAPSLLRAQTNTIMTALSSTTLSGYVDTSAQWNLGTGNANNPPYAFNVPVNGIPSKADGFNLNVVDLTLDKPEDETPWAVGYHADLWFGPDASALGTQSTGIPADFAIHQAYVTLRTPIGNGLDWKMGVFDTVIGYESFTSPNNPNYTRSYGFTIEPTQHTGLLGTYIVNDEFTLSAGIANSVGSTINLKGSPPFAESYKTYMAAGTYTVSTNAGWLSGSTLTAGVVNGFNGNNGNGTADKQTSVYLGSTISTPITALKLGASMDFLDHHNNTDVNTATGGGINGTTWAWALYASFQATEKLALNLRGEYVDNRSDALGAANIVDNNIYEFTATAQYDLWKNVLSRIEFRWDHVDQTQAFGGTTAGTPSRDNAFLIAANVIYKF